MANSCWQMFSMQQSQSLPPSYFLKLLLSRILLNNQHIFRDMAPKINRENPKPVIFKQNAKGKTISSNLRLYAVSRNSTKLHKALIQYSPFLELARGFFSSKASLSFKQYYSNLLNHDWDRRRRLSWTQRNILIAGLPTLLSTGLQHL